ncbi:MAG: hypothetical protein ABMB14_16975 [Myxococcota bacterium]
MLAALIVGLLGLLAAGYVAKDPRRRRVVINRASRTWTRMEDAAYRSSHRLNPRRIRFEDEARRIARELWDAVDDLPIVPACFKLPAVARRPYAHGAFMGAAPALLADPRWRRILAFLMPDVYHDVRSALGRGARSRELIPMFENNPVMAAFGVWRTVEARRITGETPRWGPDELEGMEWDVFLSAEAVDAWDHLPDGDERDAMLRKVVDTMVIAHASSTDTVQEQFGLCQWNDVRHTRKTALGGVEPAAWIDLFARASLLAEAVDLREAIGAMQDEPRIDSHEDCLDHTFARPIPYAEAIATYRRLTGRPRFSVVIEVKSLRCTPPLLLGLVAELNRRSIHVAAVGSFLSDELRGLSAVPQRVEDEELPGPREILFLHFAGDLQRACDRGSVRPGTSAMFNGASLLTVRRQGTRLVYAVDEPVVDEVAAYQARYDLHLGLYVQENDCDVEAAALLSDLVTRRAAVFELGFAWGGVLDEVALEGGLGDHRGFGSQRLLERFRMASTWRRTVA